MSEYLYRLQEYLERKCDTVIVTNKEMCVLIGDSDSNLQYCSEHNIPVYRTHDGGTIVNFAGDICVGNYQPTFNTYGEDFLKKFTEWLRGKGLNASFEGNDVLVDDNLKVGSYMTIYTGACLYTALHLSYGMDLEVIKQVCTKPMEKVPQGLEELGISNSDILEFVKENC